MWRILLLLPSCLALNMHEPPRPRTIRQDDIREGFVNVRLNHFDASNTDLFPMRFLYNGQLVRGDSPDVVIFVGGEWEISPQLIQGGLQYELAEDLGAGLFYTEHRYYGQTRPGNDTSVSALRFLSVDQALADLAQFIQTIRGDDFEGGRFRNGRVVLIGCSYAGSMATWMRLAYPHLVRAAYSDSGPLHAQEDFPEYLEMVAEAIRVQGSEECVTSINQGMIALQALLDSNPASVSTMFNTCSQITASSPLDRTTFIWNGILTPFAYLAQVGLPGDIATACAALTNPAQTDPLQRLANWVASQPWSQPCIESRYEVSVAQNTNTSYDRPDSYGQTEKNTYNNIFYKKVECMNCNFVRVWMYQTCVEFGWYQTTSGNNHPFLDSVSLEFFHQMCRDFFSSYFNQDRLRAGITRSNLFFAGLTHLPDYVISVVGGHDPWSPMGPNRTHETPLAPVYVVPETSHCRALDELGSTDIQELEVVKRAVLHQLYEWTTGRPHADSGSAAHAPFACIALLMAAVLVIL